MPGRFTPHEITDQDLTHLRNVIEGAAHTDSARDRGTAGVVHIEAMMLSGLLDRLDKAEGRGTVRGDDRASHLAWCKERALAYLPGDAKQAVASFLSDLGKHPETAHAQAVAQQMVPLVIAGLDVREWIEGLN